MSILKQLYKESAETKETVENINKTLSGLYTLQEKEAAEEDRERRLLGQERRRKVRDNKRRMFDAQKFKELEKDEKKKQKKNWFMELLGGLTKLVGPLLAAIQGLPAMIGGALGGLGIGAAIAKGLALLGPALVLAVKGAIIGGIAGLLAKTMNQGLQAMYQQAGGIGQTENGVGFTTQDISDMRGEAQRFADKNKAPLNSEARKRITTFYNLEESMRSRKAANDRLYTNRPKLKEMEEKYAIMKARGNKINKYDRRKRAQLSQDIVRLKKKIDKDELQKKEQTKLMKKLFKELQISEKDLVQSQIDKGRRSINDIPDVLKDKTFNDRNWTGHAFHSWNFTEYGDSTKKQNLQSGGGVFNVPGHGNGDQIPMALPAGSFVLNRNAAAMLQGGGMAPQVNTLLEPGEKVFMPGTWENNGVEAMNSAIPRKGPGAMHLQSGGHVGKAVAHIKKDEALSSLSQGENDYIKPGGFSINSRTPWGDIHGDTKLHAYKDSVGVSTIGWGNTYYDSIRAGKNPVKMGDTITKNKADDIMNTNVSALANDYSKEIPNWSKMSDSQKAGLISMGYNAPNFFTSKSFAPKLKAALTAGDMSAAADNLSWGGPSATRVSESQAMLRQGPMDLNQVTAPKAKPKAKPAAPKPSAPAAAKKAPSLMDRAKSFFGFQNGGMVNTLLEPGEKVFLPGSWDSSIAQLNQAAPRKGAAPLRRQAGGIVEASHPDTGSGWSVGTDSHGRPAVLSKKAATAFKEAMKASNGIVKPSDITSATRSPAKNTAVGGVPNSNHLYGNAVDIHGGSKAWLKANGEKFGWKNLVYSGHDGHFDFKGGGQLQPARGDGKEKTAVMTKAQPGDDSSQQSGGGVDLGLGGLFQNAGAYLGTLLGGIGNGLGLPFIGDIASALGGTPQTEKWNLGPASKSVTPKPSETSQRMSVLQEDSNAAAALGVRPVVISSGGQGVGGAQGTVTVDGTAHTDVPSLPDGPSSSAQADYFYRLPLGGVL